MRCCTSNAGAPNCCSATKRRRRQRRRAIELGVPPAVLGLAHRFLRLLAVPGLWTGSQRVEQALAASDLVAADAAARALLRRVGAVGEAWFLFGLVRHKRGRLRAAERLLRRALRCDPRLPDAHNRLGILLVADGRIEEGHRHLAEAHELAPGDPSPLLHLAQACALLGQLTAAEQHLAAAERCGADPQLAAAVRREILAKPA
jgi:Flp pilus assembly protein TadD